MMKICFVTTLSITIKAFLLDFKDYLLEHTDYDITFICNNDKSLYELCNERVHYIPVKMKRGIGIDGYTAIKKLTQIFKEQKFDIIQYSTPNAALYASIAAKKAKCKNRLYCQWGIRYMGFSPGIKRAIFKRIEKIICNNSSIIECESKSLYKFSLNEKLYLSNKASVIWNGSACGVKLKKYDIKMKDKWRLEVRNELNIPTNAFVFGYAGRITRDKGINELFSAFKTILKTKDAYLLLIGDFDNEDTIDSELKNWVLKCPNVIFAGWKKDTERYYSAMDVFCSLSYREGFGLVVIEAASMGLPGIVTDVPGQLDTIENNKNGWSVPAKNADAVADIMIHCIDNKDEVINFGKSARKRVEEKYEQQKLFKYLTKNRNKILIDEEVTQ